jgi:pseudoazurin
MTMRKVLALGALLGVLTAADIAAAAEIQVKMLNKGAEGAMVFEPSVIAIEPGDTVKFMATDKGHNAEMVEGMAPDGTKAFVGKINEELAVTFDKPGVYGVKCKPHYAMGMVAVVVVGKPDDAEQKEKAAKVVHPGRAKTVFATLLGKATTTLAQK